MIMGVQIAVTGLVGEQITTMMHKNENDYTVKNTVGYLDEHISASIHRNENAYTAKRTLSA